MQPDCDNHVQVDTVSCELQLELQKGISQAGRERGRVLVTRKKEQNQSEFRPACPRTNLPESLGGHWR